MRYTLNIIEPSLANQAGHCYGYVNSLLRASTSGRFAFHLWLDRRGAALFEKQLAHVHPYFFYRFRKWQQYFCLRRIVKQKEPLFIPTAGRWDMLLLDRLLAKYDSSPVFLHFHQFSLSEKKRALLRSLAKRHPNWVIMAPTQRLIDVFQTSGFRYCEQVPCPIESQENPVSGEESFQKVIYAGAPRQDKGFSEVVDWVCYVAKQACNMPVALQVSPPASGRFDASSEAALERLKAVHYPGLVLHHDSLETKAYQDLFRGGIALLIYEYERYRDKFSGVALSALYAGCPIVTIADTWMGDMVERFDAGVVLRDRSPKAIQEAVDRIQSNYATYHVQAKRAGEVLAQEHDPANTLAVIERYLSSGFGAT